MLDIHHACLAPWLVGMMVVHEGRLAPDRNTIRTRRDYPPGGYLQSTWCSRDAIRSVATLTHPRPRQLALTLPPQQQSKIYDTHFLFMWKGVVSLSFVLPIRRRISNSNFEVVFVSRIPQIRLKKSVTEIL